MGKMRQSSKKLSSNAMDVYEASDQNAEEKRILAHRGGGGGAVGRTFDSVAGFDFSVNEVVVSHE